MESSELSNTPCDRSVEPSVLSGIANIEGVAEVVDDMTGAPRQIDIEREAAKFLDGGDDANILCPGPSLHLAEFSQEDRDRPTVAVNQAICMDFPTQVWVAQDSPWITVTDCAESAASLECDLWTYRGFTDLWQAILPGSRVFGNPYTMNYAFRHLPWMTKVLWIHRSTFTALARLMVIGCKRISLWGCDMKEAADFCPNSGEELPKSLYGRQGVDWTRRWRQETQAIALIQREAREHGVEIRRMKSDG